MIQDDLFLLYLKLKIYGGLIMIKILAGPDLT